MRQDITLIKLDKVAVVGAAAQDPVDHPAADMVFQDMAADFQDQDQAAGVDHVTQVIHVTHMDTVIDIQDFVAAMAAMAAVDEDQDHMAGDQEEDGTVADGIGGTITDGSHTTHIHGRFPLMGSTKTPFF